MDKYFEFDPEAFRGGYTFVVMPRVFGKSAQSDTEKISEVVEAALIHRGRTHWQKFSDLYTEIVLAESNTEVAELARKMAAELNTYAIYRDALGD